MSRLPPFRGVMNRYCQEVSVSCALGDQNQNRGRFHSFWSSQWWNGEITAPKEDHDALFSVDTTMGNEQTQSKKHNCIDTHFIDTLSFLAFWLTKKTSCCCCCCCLLVKTISLEIIYLVTGKQCCGFGCHRLRWLWISSFVDLDFIVSTTMTMTT